MTNGKKGSKLPSCEVRVGRGGCRGVRVVL